jgi:hypothetical protein
MLEYFHSPIVLAVAAAAALLAACMADLMTRR